MAQKPPKREATTPETLADVLERANAEAAKRERFKLRESCNAYTLTTLPHD